MGAGLEPKKKCGKPFRRNPKATEIRVQTNIFYIVTTHPKGRTALISYPVVITASSDKALPPGIDRPFTQFFFDP
jgi:hypothetical protein